MTNLMRKCFERKKRRCVYREGRRWAVQSQTFIKVIQTVFGKKPAFMPLHMAQWEGSQAGPHLAGLMTWRE